MNQEIAQKLGQLQGRIGSKDFIDDAKSVSEWGGADVIIASRLNEGIKNWLNDTHLTISLQHTKPRRKAIITLYSRELSWLFYELRNIFASKMDHMSKYDFFGLLAESALRYIDAHKENVDCIQLLMTVLKEARSL